MTDSKYLIKIEAQDARWGAYEIYNYTTIDLIVTCDSVLITPKVSNLNYVYKVGDPAILIKPADLFTSANNQRCPLTYAIAD